MKRISRDMSVALLVMLGVACSGQPDVDKVPVGQEVAVTKADGGVVEGKITSRDDKTVTVLKGKTSKTIAKDQIADVKAVDKSKPAPVLPPVAKFREYTVPEGTKLALTLSTPISSATSKVEDPVEATLAEAVTIEGEQVLPAGSVVKGTITSAEGSAKVKGLASIAMKFTSISAAGRDDKYGIDASYAETAEATKGSDAKKIGIGAGAGAAIGAILGGKKGAAVGAGVGGGAGTAAVLATKGKEVEHASGATLHVSLAKSVDVKVPIK
jgi:hypothetical protein